MKKLLILPVAGILLFILSCQKDTPTATDASANPKTAAIEARINQVLAEADALLHEKDEADNRANVILPAGSVNGLAAAIAAAGPNGKVTVASGAHTETGTVLITHAVKITGQAGAVFTWGGLPAPDATPPIVLHPALHVQNADQVTIQGITIDPGAGGAQSAILLDNAHHAKILNNTLLQFQLAIATGNADHAKIVGNTITGVGQFFPGFAWSIVNIDGNHSLITDNDVSDNPVGIFGGDNRGDIMRNTIHQTTVGVLLCTPIALAYPNGAPLTTPESGNDWLVAHNNAHDNVWGYLAIDNAFENTIFQNAASNNTLYDIECAGDSFRFGFFTPTCHEITVISTGQYNNLTVKNCGLNCTINGGQLVDNTVDPCF